MIATQAYLGQLLEILTKLIIRFMIDVNPSFIHAKIIISFINLLMDRHIFRIYIY